MKLTEELLRAATDRADSILAAQDHDGRWSAFLALISGEPERQREAMERMLVLEIVRDAMVPNLTRAAWSKLGWNRVLSGQMSAEKFVHELRLAQAVGHERPKL